MIIFGGSKSAELGWEVAKTTKSTLGKTQTKKFPDNETYLRLMTNVEGKECAVIQSVTSNDDLVELLMMIDALKDHKATQVHAVCPYLAYMRQDKRFKEGEALTAKTVLKLIEELADSVATINCHFLGDPGQATYNNIGFTNLDAIPYLVEHLRGKISDPVVVAPDKGGLTYAKRAAELLDCEFNHIEKKRISGTEVTMKTKGLDVKKKDAIILDDIISTGGTILEASKIIRRSGAKTVNVGCVHGLFLNGTEMFAGSVDRLISTNTLINPATKVSVAGAISEHLK